MKKRIISGAAVTALAILALLAGGNFLAAALLLTSLAAFRELTKAVGVHGEKAVNELELVGFFGILLYYTFIWGWKLFFPLQKQEALSASALPALLIGTLMMLLAVYVLTFPKYHSEQVMSTFFCLLYGPVLLSFIYLTEELQHGRYVVWMIFISSWVCDTCAYFTGMAFGRHPMAPILSPKKTIEGALGGAAGSALVGGAYAWALAGAGMADRRMTIAFALISGVGAVISQIGDLAASAIKRNHAIKDYGSCIPGHGGIMDRFDSVIFTAPVVYFMAKLFLGA